MVSDGQRDGWPLGDCICSFRALDGSGIIDLGIK